MRKPIFVAALLPSVLLAACAVGPNYRRPYTPVTESYRGQAMPEPTSIADLPWWELFHDDVLQFLVAESLRNNYDLHDNRVPISGEFTSELGDLRPVTTSGCHEPSPFTAICGSAFHTSTVISPPPSSPITGNAILSWNSNSGPDLAGYKVYVGTQSGLYTFPGSPLAIGIVTSHTVTNLPSRQTNFFAVSA